MSEDSLSRRGPMIDDRIRGFPAGHLAMPLNDICMTGWKPYDGRMSLPLISLDRDAFRDNVELMMSYVRGHGIEIAPHAKTPMSTALAAELLAAGAWGTTVADIRQASVMLKAGFRRLILANEIGGSAAARRLAALLAGYPEAELHVFVDSVELVTALHSTWSARQDLPALGLLVELGSGRAGARTLAAALQIAEAVIAAETPRFRLSGLACYEGAAASGDSIETAKKIDDLVGSMGALLGKVRGRIGPQRPLIVTAGGSLYFDMVVKRLKPATVADGNSLLVLRSGAIFFHDHGIYERGLKALDDRSGLVINGQVNSASSGFRPALRVWAEVLSCPEAAIAICGMGLRDVAMDQGLPRPLSVYRGGRKLRDADGAEVVKLNDQHAFLRLPGTWQAAIGDVIEFGISHPCTCLDRHIIVYGLDRDRSVTAAYLTSFG
ncbi:MULTISPECIES: alanine racemase [Sinorhizobium]|uniref:Amino acid deaminase n=1 Tax=Sinorhizobium americanum TaxID=194963 RepID=A0A2S3YTS8_9HYPH|nr:MULTISPECIES: alanine racemase [Sinorhizobium]PDT38060.1 amino acid deaminase [Sinorhizobium sp. FG01]POH35005.1 amino acid deaminase [Sinorhizobium americanum]